MKIGVKKQGHRKIINSEKKGFSLLEVMMALFILSIGITGILTMISNSLVNSKESRDAIIASQLAQEGLELVRNIRDTNTIVSPANVFNNIPNNDDSCRIAPDNGSWNCTPADYVLRYDPDATFSPFLHVSGAGFVNSKFSRRIVVENLANGRKIRSLVYWGNVTPLPSGSNCLNINKCLYAETVLTNWGQN